MNAAQMQREAEAGAPVSRVWLKQAVTGRIVADLKLLRRKQKREGALPNSQARTMNALRAELACRLREAEKMLDVLLRAMIDDDRARDRNRSKK